MSTSTVLRSNSQLSDAIRSEFRQLQLHEILHTSPRALLGVTEDAEKALAKLEIVTVFDLATSAAFTSAVRILEAGTDLHSAYAIFGAPTADIVRETKTAGTKVDELQFLGIDALEAVPEADAAVIAKALDAANIRDLALYQPFRTAAELLTTLYFPENTADFDPERPTDLLPRTGEYPTERVQYTTLLMDAIEQKRGLPLVDLTGQAFTPIDLAALAAGDSGFQTVAFGALLTFNQSWFAQGVTLGQLLHSTSLAPGESTRIAVIDWSRRSRAGETEVISETDDLTNDASQNRAISEVTNAVATEAQSGFSHAKTNSTSTQEGTSSAGELSAPLGGLFGGPSGSIGHTSSSATTDASADSYASSFGRRDVSSSMMQNVNDRTHQHAHSSRSRRASVVKEVSQSEHEGVSTRVIANYNHMHALTIQYYEVVQIYRVEVALAKAERVIFIPIKLLDFAADDMIRRFRGALSRAAISYEIREALDNLDVVEIRPDRTTRFTSLDTGITEWLRSAVVTATRVQPFLAIRQAVSPAAVDSAAAGPAAAPVLIADSAVIRVRAATAIPIVQRVNDQLWSAGQSARLSGLLNRAVLRQDSASIYLPTDVSIEGVLVDAGGAPVTVVFGLRGGGVDTSVSATDPLPLTDITRIALTGSSPERDATVRVTLTVNRNGVRFPIELPAVTVAKARTAETPLVTVEPGGVNANLKRHLAENRLHYSQAALRSLDAAQIALLLAGLGVDVDGTVVPVAQVIDPLPIRYVGNYLAFTMSSNAEKDGLWKKWLDDHDVVVGDAKFDVVPLGTGGTFAEAVLGRSNSAEKLDITRFWDWQDSPIPLQPTEIAAIQTGSRAISEDVKPGQLSTPIINITSPQTMPDPVGTTAILQAVQNGSMFRDMSGLQATIGLAQASLRATAAGASTAGQQAGDNMNNLLKANTERQRIAAEMITSLAKTAASAYTGGAVSAGGGISPGGASQQGAKINYFDKNSTPAGSGDAAAAGSGSATGGVSSGGSSGGAGSSGGGGAAASTPLYSQNPAALQSVWGDTQSPSGMIEKIVDKVGLGSTDPTTPAGGALTTRKAWPHLDPTLVMTRVHDLVANPNLFNQGALGLCTSAAFFHHVLQRKGPQFQSFANALFGAGVGYVGELKVSPGSDLRNVDYAALLTKFPSLPPQADWMVMSALRDSANWFFDFEGAPDENSAMATSAKELSGWYESTGFYTGVSFSDSTGIPAVKATKKTASNHIALWITADLVAPGSNATHMITLETPFVINEVADSITFDYWTWGQPIKTMATKLSTFVAAQLGTITAKF